MYSGAGMAQWPAGAEQSLCHLTTLLPADRRASDDPVLWGASSSTVKRDTGDTAEQGKE